MRIHNSVAVALTFSATAAMAASQPTQDAARRPVEKVVVTAHPLSAEGLALSSEVLEGEALSRELASSIGETVGNQPGVHAASFGQAASRPVIHGLSGARVRIMEDRIDTLDVSVTSADHAVTIEPFIADRIEVLKGPSTLLYGSGAIGGVVDVHTGRIPHAAPERAVSGRVELRRANNAQRETAAGRLDGGIGPLAWHLDGFSREADEYEIPGFVEPAELRAAEGEAEPAAKPGTLPGSQLDSSGGAMGLSLVGDRGFIGAAVSVLDGRYGLPGGHEHGHEEEEETEAGEEHDDTATPTLDLEQTRFDFEAGLSDPLPGFGSANLRVGVNDYQHEEIEPDGAVATVFDNEAVEARLELRHNPVAGWDGALGVQVNDREFSAAGEEAFIAPVDTSSTGIFWVGQQTLRNFDLEGGLRVGRVEVDSSTGASRDFTSYAASLGIIVPFGQAWSLGLLSDYTQRAPIAEELYSNGPHLATRAFEIGNPDLDEEQALSLSANLRYAGERWFLNATVYYNDFRDFIYESATGVVEDDLPVFVYAQEDAAFVGFDAEVRATVFEWERGSLALNASYDTVSGELDVAGNDNLPRIPPERIALGVAADWGLLRASVEHEWVREQNEVADFELPTDSYRNLRAYLGCDLPLGAQSVTLFVQGRNLSDDDQRQHPSFIKDFAPLPGRTVEAGIRARF